MELPLTGGNPNSFGISPMIITKTRPNTNPVTMGLERNSAAHPRRKSPAASRPSPAPMASAAVRAAARSGSPAAIGATIEPDTTDTVETGPTMRWGDDPKIA